MRRVHTGGMERPLILTDADCGFCQRAATHVPRLGVQVQVSTVQGEDLSALGVDPERAMREMAFVGTDGQVVYGAPAWAAALRTGPVFWRGVGRLMQAPGLRAVAARFYTWVAANRYRLPGGSSACALPSPLVRPGQGE